jgi:DNA-binding NarL/FixJ family response regulator
VILDLQVSVMDGLEAAGQINVLAPHTAMLMFTMRNCEQLLKYAPAAATRDVLSKSDGLAERLLACLKSLQVEHRACA